MHYVSEIQSMGVDGCQPNIGSSVAVLRLDRSARSPGRRIADNGEPVEREVGKLPLMEHIARKVDDDRMHVAYVDAHPHESSGRAFNDMPRAQHDLKHLMALAAKLEQHRLIGNDNLSDRHHGLEQR